MVALKRLGRYFLALFLWRRIPPHLESAPVSPPADTTPAEGAGEGIDGDVDKAGVIPNQGLGKVRKRPSTSLGIEKTRVQGDVGARDKSKDKAFLKGRIAKVLAMSVLGCMVVSILYAGGFLDWYIAIKGAMPPGALFYWLGAILDVLTGVFIWGSSDIVGQYLNRGRDIRLKQSFVVSFFGIFQGLSTHILLNIPDLLPVLLWSFGQKLLRTAVVLTGGLVISIVFAGATSLGRRFVHVEDYSKSQEFKKTADVILTKLFLAPFKTFTIINILPQPVRVISEQIWDYLMTILSSYLMNRKKSIFLKRWEKRSTKQPRDGSQAEAEPSPRNGAGSTAEGSREES